MKTKNLPKVQMVLFGLGLLLVTSSCLKDKADEIRNKVTSFDELTIPKSFTFNTTQSVSVKLSISDPDKTSLNTYIAKIYNKDPKSSGNLLVSGAISKDNYTFSATVKVPTSLSELWVEVYFGDNLVSSSALSIVGTVAENTIYLNATAITKSASIVAPTYSTNGYTVLSGNVSASAGSKYYVPAGQSYSGGLNFDGGGNGTLYLIIEGTANFSYFNINNGKLEVIIGASGSVTSNTFQEIKSNYTLTSYSLSFTNPTTMNGKLINYGIANLSSNFTINSGGDFKNYGTANISGAFQVNSYYYNYGKTNVAGNLQINGSGTVDNYCSLIVSGNFGIDGILIMENSSYAYATGETKFNGSGTPTLNTGSYLKTGSLYTDGENVHGPSSGNAILQYLSSKGGNKLNKIPSSIYLVDAAGNGTNGKAVNYYIASSDCSPGFGAAPATDADGDGIPDSKDAFPNDAERAFISYYPNNSTWGTLMFEDQWPSLGDYDFNDLVIKYQFEFISNAGNNVVDMIANYQVVASGATFNNGFGFILPIPNGHIKSVSGCVYSGSSINLNNNGTERTTGNESAIIVYDNISASIGKMFNVTKTGTTLSPNPITVQVSFRNNVTLSDLSDINQFLYVDQVRGREVHLIGYSPTKAADSSYFGVADDNSTSGTYYRSVNGYPWCLDVPSDISYMLETKDLVTGYPDFINWAQSGGTQNTDWYHTNINSAVMYK